MTALDLTSGLNCAAFLSREAARRPRAVAIIHPGRGTRTYRELDQRTAALSAGLAGLGLQAGDRLVAWLETSLEYAELYLTAARSGLVLVPMNRRLSVREAAHIIADSGARCLVFSASSAERVEELASICALEQRVMLGSGRPPAGVVHFTSLLTAGDVGHPKPMPDASDFVIAYTSGTTGKPRGAVMTHASSLAVWRLNSHSFSLVRGGTYTFISDLSIASPAVCLMLPQLYLGGCVVLVDGLPMDRVVDIIAQTQSTSIHLPSPFEEDFLAVAEAEPAKIASLVTALHGGAPLTRQVRERLWRLVGPGYIACWGMTENTGGGVTATTRADAMGQARAADFLTSVGSAVIDVDVRVVGEDGQPITSSSPEQVGELHVSSPALVRGYWNDEQATERAFADGWYHTGDLGWMDDAGYVYMVDRRTDLIISGGMNVYPSEVEAVINQLPFIRESAVVGIPHPRWGTGVAAIVVPVAMDPPRSAELIEFCRASIASYKKPLKVFAVAELPRTSTGKIRRALLREWACSGQLGEW
jgi:fatty-acyl-CoA synthase